MVLWSVTWYFRFNGTCCNGSVFLHNSTTASPRQEAHLIYLVETLTRMRRNHSIDTGSVITNSRGETAMATVKSGIRHIIPERFLLAVRANRDRAFGVLACDE